MKLPKFPIPFKRNVETEGVENVENIEADKRNVKIGNVDEENVDEENVDESDDKENTTKITKILWKHKPLIVALISWAIMEIFKIPRIINISICVLIVYFGYFVVIPKPNEVLVVERLGVPREKLLERLIQTSVTSSTDSKNPFRRLTFLLPFIDKIVKRVSLAHIPFEMPPYEAKALGGADVWLNSKVIIQVTNPLNYTYNIDSVQQLIHDSTKTQILTLAGQMELEEIRKNVAPINKKLAENISTFIDTAYYGFRLVTFVIQSSDVPDDINEAMAKREKARLEGEAARELAKKELEIAELHARRKVTEAQGNADAINIQSEAEAKQQERLLKPFVEAGIADKYAQSLVYKNLPPNSTLFLGGSEGKITPDTAYLGKVIKEHSSADTTTSTEPTSE